MAVHLLLKALVVPHDTWGWCVAMVIGSIDAVVYVWRG